MKIKRLIQYIKNNYNRILYSKKIILYGYLFGILQVFVLSTVESIRISLSPSLSKILLLFWDDIISFVYINVFGMLFYGGVIFIVMGIAFIIDLNTKGNIVSRFIELTTPGFEGKYPILCIRIRLDFFFTKMAFICIPLMEILIMSWYALIGGIKLDMFYVFSDYYDISLGMAFIVTFVLLPSLKVMEKKYNRIPKD